MLSSPFVSTTYCKRWAAVPFPCGSDLAFETCCSVLIQGLQTVPPIRVWAALMMWWFPWLLDEPNGLRQQLSAAARAFWHVVFYPFEDRQATVRSHSGSSPTPNDGCTDRRNIFPIPGNGFPASRHSANRLGDLLFHNLWRAVDQETQRSLLATLPIAARQPEPGKLALDWLLWDHPWLGGQPVIPRLTPKLRFSTAARSQHSWPGRVSIDRVTRSRLRLRRLVRHRGVWHRLSSGISIDAVEAIAIRHRLRHLWQQRLRSNWCHTPLRWSGHSSSGTVKGKGPSGDDDPAVFASRWTAPVAAGVILDRYPLPGGSFARSCSTKKPPVGRALGAEYHSEPEIA